MGVYAARVLDRVVRSVPLYRFEVWEKDSHG